CGWGCWADLAKKPLPDAEARGGGALRCLSLHTQCLAHSDPPLAHPLLEPAADAAPPSARLYPAHSARWIPLIHPDRTSSRLRNIGTPKHCNGYLDDISDVARRDDSSGHIRPR
ncbi:MAG: hypothetical protein RMJ29_02490, partial [Candidatus Bipolaricaulota bacterium]|nr:hypothetical protein [Candidatus Bipolaricaulota bacterium]